jgi:hypothetical protein
MYGDARRKHGRTMFDFTNVCTSNLTRTWEQADKNAVGEWIDDATLRLSPQTESPVSREAEKCAE